METEDNPRCNCGHMIRRSHTINIKKTMKNNVAIGKCKFCNCKEISI